MSREKVELHTAYSWDCPQCGRESFVRAVVVELTPDDVIELLSVYGGDIDYWANGHWTSRPDDVTCPHCKNSWQTVEWENGDTLMEDWPTN